MSPQARKQTCFVSDNIRFAQALKQNEWISCYKCILHEIAIILAYCKFNFDQNQGHELWSNFSWKEYLHIDLFTKNS